MENYEKKYKEALERAKSFELPEYKSVVNSIFPELQEDNDERIRKTIIRFFKDSYPNETEMYDGTVTVGDAVAWLERQKEPKDKGEIFDGYHTFNELYRYRMLYNAAFFNLLPKEMVHKSKRHHDGKECFGGGWFIVMANLPTGQISNHYELKDWNLFQIPEKEIADEWDGHTPQEAAERLHKYLLEKQGEILDKDKLDKGFLRSVAISIMNWLVANTPEGKMCLSNMECEDIENAVRNADWMKIYRYMQKKLENHSDEYIIVEWPDIQYLMEQEDFNENCYLVNDDSSAYFVNKQWLQDNTN